MKTNININMNTNTNKNILIGTNTNTNTNINNLNSLNINRLDTVTGGCYNDWRSCLNINELLIEDKYGSVKITPHYLKSSFNEEKNLFAFIETLKNILIKKNIITEDEFNEIYNSIQTEYTEKIESYKVADKLMEDSSPKTFNYDYIDFNKYFNQF